MKYKVYYGSEENGYEEDFLGEFNTINEAKQCVASNLEDDFSNANDIANAISQVSDEGYEGENEHGYHIVYVIGEQSFCLSVLYGLQEDFIEEFANEDETEE